MHFKAKVGIVFFSTVVAFYSIVGGFMSNSGQAVARGSQYAQITIFDEVLSHIVRDYVDQPDLEKVRIGSLRGVAEGLDPYSAYLTPEQARQYDPNPSRGETGLILSKVGGFAYVVAVLKGSPAEQAGVREGDFIEYVQKIPSRDLSIYETEQLVNGAPGTSVELRIFRRGNSRRFNVGRAKLAQPPVESRIEEPGVGYIKITSLADGKANEVKTAISGLVSKGAQKLVLDLRGAANGKLQEGVSVANLFVGSGVLARVTGKNDAEVKSFAADPSKVVFQGPLVVVVDRSTAGPAEAIAAAVINQNRGEVVGERTFGAGSEQQLFSLADGGAFLITTAKYAPPSGKPFMDEPINPTVKVDRPLEADLLLPDTSDDDENVDEAPPTPVEPPPPAVEDIQLKKAVELLKNSAAKGASANKRAALRKPGGSRFAQAA
jgi:carboxyl-terminal processing protease